MGSTLNPWLIGQWLSTNHPDEEQHQLFDKNSRKTINMEWREAFKRASLDNVQSLALKIGSGAAKELLRHELGDYPTMEKGCNRRETFFHASPMMLWSMHYLDVDYILVIPEEFGPIYNKKAMSGRDYVDVLTEDDRQTLEMNNLCPCLLPAGLIPQSLHRSTTKHLDSSEACRSSFIYVGDTAAGSYYFSLMKKSRLNTYNTDRVHSLIAIPRDSLGKSRILPVGINSRGCANLGYTSGVIRISNM